MTFTYDPARDTHLDLLDVHLLPMLQQRKLTPAELASAAADHKRLAAGDLDVEVVQRWCEAARLRYLVDLEDGRYGITDEGRKHLARLKNAARALAGQIPGVAKIIGAGGTGAGVAKAGGATVLIAGAKLLALPLLGAGALVANTNRFLRSTTVVQAVMRKEHFVRAYPETHLDA